jgi:lipopolysaccharide export system protein LptA
VGAETLTLRIGPRRLRSIAAGAAALALWGALAPRPGLALPDDRNQPIYIQSDRAERDERKGTTVYTGDVEIDQGSLHISADRVTIAMDGDQVTRIDAIGAPAKMHQKPSPEREPVYARATTIQYDVAREILTLIEKAAVTQEGSTVKGERIEYFVQEQRVKASSGSAESGASRVQMVIQPRRATLAPPAANDGQPPAEASPDGAP